MQNKWKIRNYEADQSINALCLPCVVKLPNVTIFICCSHFLTVHYSFTDCFFYHHFIIPFLLVYYSCQCISLSESPCIFTSALHVLKKSMMDQLHGWAQGQWNMLSMMWRSRVWTPVELNLGCVVLLSKSKSKSYLNKNYTCCVND